MKKLKDKEFFHLLHDFMTLYLPLQRACSANTVKSYKDSFNLLLLFLSSQKHKSLFDVSFESLSKQNVMEFLDWLEMSRHCSSRTRNQRLSAIRSFLCYAAKMNILLVKYQNELNNVPSKKDVNKSMVPFLSESSLKAVLQAPDPTTRIGLRDMTYLILLYDSGARNGEMLSARLCDLDLTPHHAKLTVTGKGGKKRTIPVMDKTAQHCKKYLDVFHHDELDAYQPLFYILRNGCKKQMSPDNVARLIKVYAENARMICPEMPEHVYPHMFRHTRAMHLYKGGMPLALIAEWLGHSQLETTLIYAYADTEMKRKAIESATKQGNPILDDRCAFFNESDDSLVIRKLCGLI